MKRKISLFAGLLCVVALAGCEGDPRETGSSYAGSQTARNVAVSEQVAVYDETTRSAYPEDWIDEQFAQGKRVQFADPIDAAAAQFVETALYFGRWDSDYVDAYFGPKAWVRRAEAREFDTGLILQAVADLQTTLDALEGESEERQLRIGNLRKLARAMGTRAQSVESGRPSFDEEVAEIL